MKCEEPRKKLGPRTAYPAQRTFPSNQLTSPWWIDTNFTTVDIYPKRKLAYIYVKLIRKNKKPEKARRPGRLELRSIYEEQIGRMLFWFLSCPFPFPPKDTTKRGSLCWPRLWTCWCKPLFKSCPSSPKSNSSGVLLTLFWIERN